MGTLEHVAVIGSDLSGASTFCERRVFRALQVRVGLLPEVVRRGVLCVGSCGYSVPVPAQREQGGTGFEQGSGSPLERKILNFSGEPTTRPSGDWSALQKLARAQAARAFSFVELSLET